MGIGWMQQRRTHEITAYCLNPLSTSLGSNVPMQPLSLFSANGVPFGFVTTFHVTNSGVAVSLVSFAREKKLLRLLLLLVAELASLAPLGVELVLWTLDELLLAGEGASRREMAAGR